MLEAAVLLCVGLNDLLESEVLEGYSCLFDLSVLCCVSPVGSFIIHSSDSEHNLTSTPSREPEKNGMRALLLPNYLANILYLSKVACCNSSVMWP